MAAEMRCCGMKACLRRKSFRTLCEVSIQDNIMYLDSVYEIWELNSNYLAFLVANTFAPPKPPFCLLLPELAPVKTQRWGSKLLPRV